MSDPTPRRLLAPSTDAKAVADALTEASKINAQSRLAMVRRSFLDQNADMKGGSEEQFAQMSDLRSSIAEETVLVRNFLGRLSSWVGTYPRRTPQALFLVADGFDVTPSDFYAETLYPTVTADRHAINRAASGRASPQDIKQMASARRASGQQKQLESESLMDSGRSYHPLARQLAAAGWTVVSLRGGLNAELSSDSSMGSGGKAVSNFVTGGGNTGIPSRTLQLRPVEALATFAEATGGELVADTSKFGRTIDMLSNRIKLTYQVSRGVDGAVRQIDVQPRREGLIVHSARYASSSTPELVATSRASMLIDRGEPKGELPVGAKLQLEPGSRRDNPKGTLETRVQLAPLTPLRPQLKDAVVRVTIGVSAGDEQPRIIHQVHPNFDLSRIPDATFTSPMQLPRNVDKIAVVVEELTTGAWGGAVLAVEKNQDVIATAGWTEAQSGTMPWLEWDAALQQAQREGKLIVQCAGCDEKVFTDSTLRNLVETAFVPTRKADANARFVVLDPRGNPRVEWKASNAPEVTAKLRQVMQHGSTFVRAGELGDTFDSHFALGFAYLRMQSFAEAQREYQLAESAARAAGNDEMAQRAQIQGAAALAQSGKREPAINALEKITKAPASPATEAEAWLILGHLRKAGGNGNAAMDAYRRAAEKAPAGSELAKVAEKLAGQ